MQLTQALINEYKTLYDSAEVQIEQVQPVIDKILRSKNRYEKVALSTDVPWQAVAAIHSLEASLNFTRHLHNGDPLEHRTVHVPANRPISGTPPFTWEESAIDALRMKAPGFGNKWTIPQTLFFLEGYNGWGYRRHHPNVLTPYLWSMTNHYVKGKYVADGKFSETAVSKQIGAVPIIKTLIGDDNG